MTRKLGVICSIEKSKYCLITDGGDFVMKKGSPPAGKGVGDRVDLSSSSRRRMWLSVAAALILMVVSSVHFLPQPTNDGDFRLALDINPSIQLSYDDRFQLTGWKAFNPEGLDLLESLQRPDSLYEALAAIFERSVYLGLAQDDHDVFITIASDSPLDEDRVLGAFQGRGAAVKLHMVHLDEDDFQDGTASPLKNHLKVKAGIEFDEDSVAALAAVHLTPDIVTSIEIAPWHNNPLVQLFAERYLVSSSLAEEMLAQGLTGEEVVYLLELGRAGKLTPADIFKELKNSGLAPGQFLQQHKHADKVEAAEIIVMDWLSEFLAQEFGYSQGQISSHLRRGIGAEDLQALLVLEALTGEKLQHLVRKLQGSNLESVIIQSGVELDAYDQALAHLDLTIGAAEKWLESDIANRLLDEYNISRAEVLSILSWGYGLDEAREIIEMAKGPLTIRELLPALESAIGDEKALDEIDKDNKAPKVREKLKKDPPGRATAPGQQKTPPGQEGTQQPESPGKGKGNN